MRKRFLTSLLIAIALILAACGSNSPSSSGNAGSSTKGIASGTSYNSCPSSTNTTAAAPTSGTVNLTVAGWASTPAEDGLVQSNLKKFEQLHPNIHLTWSPITGDYPTKMRANVASGSVPDVFYLSPDMSSSPAPTGHGAISRKTRPS
jgi:multiple sugar transport system substrate-binding protein